MTLKSGAKSLRSLDHMETFHPNVGPQVEANILHVEQQELIFRCQIEKPLVIWDVGFGAAANAITALDAFRRHLKILSNSGAQIEIHSFDKSMDPLRFALKHAKELEYLLGYENSLEQLIHRGSVEVLPFLKWHFHEGDFREVLKQSSIAAPHSIFYDPYSPKQNPNMWTLEHFKNLYQRLDPKKICLWSNYTRSTSVRVSLLLAGFYVGIGSIIGEKDETTVASNYLSALKNPLDLKWLERVKISGNAAPLYTDQYSLGPITPLDFEKLKACAQFQK